MSYKSYHFQLGRVIYGVRNAIYDMANHANVSVTSFNQSGILFVDYYITIYGTEENIRVFERYLAKSFERLEND